MSTDRELLEPIEPIKLEPVEVYWDMDWGNQYPEKPPVERMFEETAALAVLLLNEVVFINAFWYKKDWPEEAKRMTVLCVNCNDVFAWACVDAEELEYSEIQSLYDHFAKDKTWGSAVWCIKKRKSKAQKPVYNAIMKAGIWDLDAIYASPSFSASEEEELS